MKRGMTRVKFDTRPLGLTFDNWSADLLDGRVNTLLKNESKVIVDDAKTRSSYLSRAVSNSIRFIEKGFYPLSVLIGPKYPEGSLAHLFEYGTAPRYTDSGEFRGEMEAQPFMRPAFENNRDAVTEGIKIGLKKIVKSLNNNK